MFVTRLLLNSILVTDFLIISDIFKYKNTQHGVHLNMDPNTAVASYEILREANLRFSSRTKNTSSIIIPHSYQKIGVILNTSCDNWKEVLNSLDKTKPFKTPFIWIVVTEDLEETTEVFSQYPIEVDSDITIIYKKDIVRLYEIYNTGFTSNGEVIVRNIGFWNSSLHIDTKDRWDLRGVSVRTMLVITKSQKEVHETFIDFLEREQPSLTTFDSIHRFKYYEVLKYYRDIFNISYIFRRTSSWGYPINGSFDGMVGALQKFEADFGGSPMFVRTDRAMAVDYVAETWPTSPGFIFRHPKHPGGYYTIYTRPLSIRVWYCIIAFLVLSTTTLGMMLRLSIKLPTDEKEESMSLALLFIWGAICQQGVMISRSSTAVKIVVFVTFISALTLYQYYNALVVSALLQAPPKNIKTAEDLLKTNLKAGVEDVLYTKDFFKRTTDPVAIKIYNTKIFTNSKQNFYTAEVGMELVKRGGFAFHIDNAVAHRIMQNTFSSNELCDATEIPMYWSQNIGVAIAKRSPYREYIAYGIRKMKERGILHRLKTKWDAPRLG